MKKTQRRISIGISMWAISLTAAAGCNDPFPPDTTDHGLEDCAASEEWLLDPGGAYVPTPPVPMFNPLPHPTTECPFYRGGWQNFLVATQPTDASGTPALVTRAYPTIDDVFSPRVAHGANRSYLGDIKQAGQREILIDQNGNTLFYSIQVNPAYADFIHVNHLETSKAIQAYPSDPKMKNLFFPAGVAEFKAAWQVVEGDAASIADQTKDYISFVTSVPTMHTVVDATTQAKSIVENRDQPRANITVRLLALHVVYTLPGHPEFIWASFEHTAGPPDAGAADLQRNLAPTFDGENPSDADRTNIHVTAPASMDDKYLLYKAGTAVNKSNASIPEGDLNLVEATQKFMDPNTGMPQQTSIYRMFPASKSNTIDPDQAITSLNHNVESIFIKANAMQVMPANDKRQFYRLVGGQWMDKPAYYHVDFPIQNDHSSPFAQIPDSDQDTLAGKVGVGPTKFDESIKTEGSDSAYSLLAGEDRMSSTAMESFTQAPGNFNNCFTCHNTQAINANGVPSVRQPDVVKLLDPGLLNVSHVISQFVLEDCGSNVVTDNNGSRAVCP